MFHAFLSELGTSPGPDAIAKLLDIDPHTNAYVVGLYNAGLDMSQVKTAVDSITFFNDSWMAFSEVVLSFIRLCLQLDPALMVVLFDLYASFVGDIAVAFTNATYGGHVAPLMVQTVEVVVPMAKQLDALLRQHEADAPNPRATYLALVLLKVFNNVRLQITDTTQKAKQLVLLFVSNKLCLIYLFLGNPLLCRNVFSNLNTANVKFAHFDRSDQLQYRFNLARFYLVKYELVSSYAHLRWCIQRCLPRERAMVVRYALPLALVLGYAPNFAAVDSFLAACLLPATRFVGVYAELAPAVQAGDLLTFYTLLDKHEDYLKQVGTLLLLKTKLPILVHRNLVRQMWILCGRQLTLDYDAVKRALGLLWRVAPEKLNDYTVENIIVLLVDQNLLRGKIVPSSRKVAVASSNVFPMVPPLYERKFGGSHSDGWMDL